MQCLEVSDQISQILIAEGPAGHICVQLCAIGVLAFLSANMHLNHLAEMEAHDGQRDGQWEQARTPEQGPEKELPVLDAFNAADPKLVVGTPGK